MFRVARPSILPVSRLLAASIVLVALIGAGCAPSAGPLGTPATPPVTDEPSVVPPSSDATPGLSPTPGPSPTAVPSASVGPSAAPSATITPAPTATPTPTPAGTVIVRAYFCLYSSMGNEGLVPVLREVPQTKAVATAAMRALLQGPNADERAAQPGMVSTIPDGTLLLGLSIKGGVATVNLSREFESGGGSASVLARLAQVVYTLTQFSTVDGVRFELDGQPVTLFSGEGVILDHAMGRADYRDQLPTIFVDRPAWGASLGNPGTVSGLANVFEGTFQIQLLDANGKLLVDRYQMASCGNGCWGTFRTTLSYVVARAQYGTLRVFDYSAKDGSVENLTEYKVWLTPAG